MPTRRQPPPIEAAIFDLDGTLLDSASEIAAAINPLFEARGLETFGTAEILTHIGWGSRRLIETTFSARGASLTDTEAATAEHAYLANYARTAERAPVFYAGAVELLRDLKAMAIRLGLCTNKPEAITRSILARAGLYDVFDAIVGGDSGFGLKPSSGPTRAIRQKLGVPAARTIYVGDSAIDAEAALGAELPFAHIQHKDHPIPILPTPPQWRLTHLSRVRSIIEARARESAPT